MRISFLKPLFAAVFLLILSSCEDQLNKRVILYVQSITIDKPVVAQGEFVNLYANINLSGPVSQNDGKYLWEATGGTFSDPKKQATIWTAPTDAYGDYYIRLTVKFASKTAEAEAAIRVVKTPAGGWGSLSGNLLTYDGWPMPDVGAQLATGEADTTDSNGFFYIENAPQGTTSINFTDVGFLWASDLTEPVNVSGGTHNHLGQITIFESMPAEIIDTTMLPNRQTNLGIFHNQADIYKSFDIYEADNTNGLNAKFVKRFPASLTETIVANDKDSSYYALKAIPFTGMTSDFSEWIKIYFID